MVEIVMKSEVTEYISYKGAYVTIDIGANQVSLMQENGTSLTLNGDCVQYIVSSGFTKPEGNRVVNFV